MFLNLKLDFNLKQDIDLILPAKIKDLTVTEQDYFKGTIAFSFTAPGDDADFGNSNNFYNFNIQVFKMKNMLYNFLKVLFMNYLLHMMLKF